MTREYSFQKKVKDEQIAEILKDAEGLEGLQKIVITEDHMALQVTAEDGDFQYIMERLLNIVSRVAGGQWISFKRFVYED
ncbi:MAG: hypothetical protein Q4B09_07775 [Lachnospiraceae bacterium]|nr:hypothetical protein [Lachnospiraceae bacterium]